MEIYEALYKAADTNITAAFLCLGEEMGYLFNMDPKTLTVDQKNMWDQIKALWPVPYNSDPTPEDKQKLAEYCELCKKFGDSFH